VYASFNTIDGKITKVSKSFQKVYDIENKDIIGKTINALIPKGLYGAHDDLMKNFRNKGTMNVIMKGKKIETSNFRVFFCLFEVTNNCFVVGFLC